MTPQKGMQQDMSSSRAFLQIENNLAKGYFPYFGVIRQGGSYNDGGIEFDNEIKNYKKNFNDDKKRININFEVSGKSEHYFFDIFLNKGLYSKITISSNKRDSISFDGYIQIIEE